MLTRVKKWSWLKAWAMNVAKRRGRRKAIVALARRLAVIMHRMWSDGTEFRWTRRKHAGGRLTAAEICAIEGDQSSACRWKDVLRGTMDEVSSLGSCVGRAIAIRTRRQIGPPHSTDPMLGAAKSRSRREARPAKDVKRRQSRKVRKRLTSTRRIEKKAGTQKASAEQVAKDIRRATRKQYGAEEKIRIVLDGLRGEESIAALCRREGIAESLYYNWSKEFLEAGKKRLAGDTARAATSDEVKAAAPRDPRSEGGRRRAGAGTASAQKKHDRGWGRRRMRYPASEKLEIIRLVEQSHLPARRTLEKLGIPRATFHRWYDRFLTGGVEALEDRRPWPKRVWNRIPEAVRERIIELGSEQAGAVAARTGGDVHRRRKLFCLRGFGLSPAQGPRPDHQPGLHRHQGRRRVQGQDDGSRTSSGRPTSPI